MCVFWMEKGTFLEAGTWHTSPSSLHSELTAVWPSLPWVLDVGFLGHNIYAPCTYAPTTVTHTANSSWYTVDLICSQLPCEMGIWILNFVTEILGFIDFLKFIQLLEWKGQDSKPGFSDGRIRVLFIVIVNAGNSASLKEILDLEATKMRINLVRRTLCDSVLKLLCEPPWNSPDWTGFIDSFNFSIGKRLKGHPAQLPGGLYWMLSRFSWGRQSILSRDSTNS